MKKRITIALILIIGQWIHSQNFHRIDSLKHYFEANEKSLNQIEGFWELNVINKLYENDSIIAEEVEMQRSYWAIAKHDDSSFKVLDISNNLFGSNFDAKFEEVPTEDHYYYTCHFKKPNWSQSSIAQMFDGDKIIYEYFVSDEFLINMYGPGSENVLNLQWQFIWMKVGTVF